MSIRRIADAAKEYVGPVLLLKALSGTDALADEPIAAPEVQETTAASGAKARTVILQGQATAGVGVNTLDSDTAIVRDYSALFADLNLEGGVRPIPLPGWEAIYLGGEAEGRFGAGSGLSVLAVEAGVRLLDSRFGLDVGYGRSWNPLDGISYSTIDGVPYASLDVSGRPFEGPLKSVVLRCTVGSTFPPDSEFHPAHMDLVCGAGIAGGLNLPALSRSNAVAHGSVENNSVSTAPAKKEDFRQRVPELPAYNELPGLPDKVKALEAQYMKLATNFFVTDPGLTERAEYLIDSEDEGGDVSAPSLDVQTYYERELQADSSFKYISVAGGVLAKMNPEEKSHLYFSNINYRVPYLTADKIDDMVQASNSMDYGQEQQFFEDIFVYVKEARALDIYVDQETLCRYIILKRIYAQSQVELERHTALNKLRYKAYKLAQEESAQRKEYNQMAATDRVQCAKNTACSAQSQANQLSDDLKKKMDTAYPPTAAYPVYRNLLEARAKGATLTPDDYKNGYEACKRVGRMDLAIEAANERLKRFHSRDAVEQVEYLTANFGYIEIKHDQGGLTLPLFDPSLTPTIEAANKKLVETGHFEGDLPIGHYNLNGVEFDVVAGKKNKPVR